MASTNFEERRLHYTCSLFLHRDRSGLLRRPIGDYQDLFIESLRFQKRSQQVHVY